MLLLVLRSYDFNNASLLTFAQDFVFLVLVLRPLSSNYISAFYLFSSCTYLF